MLALSIRQPYAELILRGLKRIEYRSRPTRLIGERFWIYASKKPATLPAPDTAVAPSGPAPFLSAFSGASMPITSTDLVVEPPPPWMIELANAMRLFPQPLPTGLLLGSAIIEKCVKADTGHYYEWHLGDVERFAVPRPPKGHPQPAWWRTGD